MLEQLIHDCRKRISSGRSSLLRRLGFTSAAKDLDPTDTFPQELRPHYLELLASGTVVWGCIAQANSRLFFLGEEDLPANTVFSPCGYFDSNPGHLADIAHSIFELKNTTPDDPVLAAVAVAISDEFNQAENELLPPQLTDGFEVYFSTTIVHRSRLPNRILSDNIFPLLISPEGTPANMILPLKYWPQRLIQNWGGMKKLVIESPRQDRAAESHERPRKPTSSLFLASRQAAEQSVALISLTPAAAKALFDIKKSQNIPDNFLCVAIDNSDKGIQHSVKLAPDWDRELEMCIESSGVQVILPIAQIDMLAGSVVDYRKSIYGTGFVVRNPNV